MKRLCLMVFALSAIALDVQAQSPGRTNWYVVPYEYLSAKLATDIYLKIPMAAYGESYAAFSKRAPRSDSEAALGELLRAIYANDVDGARRRLRFGAMAAKYPTPQAYFEAFRQSLTRFGELTIVGRIDLEQEAWWVARGASGAIRVFRFAAERGSGTFVFDEERQPSKQQMLMLSTLSFNRAPAAAQVSALSSKAWSTVPLLKSTPEVELVMKLRRGRTDLLLGEAPSSDRATEFVRQCYGSLKRTQMDAYFRCFDAETAAQLKRSFESMKAPEQAAFTEAYLKRTTVQYVIDAGPVSMLELKDPADGTSAHIDVVELPSGAMVLAGPSSSNALSRVLNDRETKASLAARPN
jgi:hypothetical protein